MDLANKGLGQACLDNAAICEGVNTLHGHVTYPGVAESQGRQWREVKGLL